MNAIQAESSSILVYYLL